MHAMVNGKMPPEVKARWVAALRSGEFKQGKGQLCVRKGGYLRHNERAEVDHFCCLGVLNQILDLGCADNESMLILEHAAGRREKLAVLNQMTQNTLIHLNDNEGMSFIQLADWIEENI